MLLNAAVCANLGGLVETRRKDRMLRGKLFQSIFHFGVLCCMKNRNNPDAFLSFIDPVNNQIWK